MADIPDKRAGAIKVEKLPKSLTGSILTTLFLSAILALTAGAWSTTTGGFGFDGFTYVFLIVDSFLVVVISVVFSAKEALLV